MNDATMILIQQIIIMFLLMMVGFGLFKFEFFTSKETRTLSNLVLYIANPAIILYSFLGEFDAAKLLNSGMTLGLILLIYGVSIAVVMVFFKKTKDVTKFGIIFNNVSFLGIPLVQGVLGTEAVFYMTIIAAVMGVLVWTVGIYIISKDKNEISWMKIILNPTILATLVGMTLYIGQIQVPEVFSSTMNYLGGMNAPVAMIVLGCYLAESDIPSILKEKEAYITCFGRLILMPALTWMILKICPFEIAYEVQVVVIIASSTPIASMMAMFSQKYEKNYAYSAGVVSFSTILSLITMPLFLSIL